MALAAITAGQESKNQDFYKVRSQLHREVNGASLTATASVKETDAAMVEIKWSIEYTGSRQPLTILKPSLQFRTSGQTKLIVYAESEAGVPHARNGPRNKYNWLQSE